MVYSWIVEKLHSSKPKKQKAKKRKQPYNNICNLPNIDYDFFHYTEVKTDKGQSKTN